MKFDAIEKLTSLGKENTEALVKSSTAAAKGLEDLAKVSQDYLSQSVAKADITLKALFSVKSPTEFYDLNTKLAREAVETAVSDSRKFAELAQSVVTSTMEPLNARFAAVQSLLKPAA